MKNRLPFRGLAIAVGAGAVVCGLVLVVLGSVADLPNNVMTGVVIGGLGVLLLVVGFVAAALSRRRLKR